VAAHRNLAEALRVHAAVLGDCPALRTQDRTISWAELDERVDAYARGLTALGLEPSAGHPARIAVALPNTVEFAVAYLATLRAGLVSVPLNPGYTGPELAHLLGESGARVLIGTDDVVAEVTSIRDALPDLTHVYRAGDAPSGPGAPVPDSGGDEDLAVLLYTSGSLGRPKGAMLTHRALMANHEQLAAISPPVVRPDDVALLAVPLFHAYGLNAGLGAIVYHGATGVLVEAFDPAESLARIAAERVSVVIGVPTMFLAWSLRPDLAEAFASVRLSVCGAAPMTSSLMESFHAGTGSEIYIGYGLTETAPVLTTTLGTPAPKPGSIGRAIPGVTVSLRAAGGDEVWRSDVAPDPDDFDDDASGSPGTDPGEIVVRGANLFSGYWPDRHEAPGPDGWWATGDVAYADGDGDLFLVDRLRELIIVNGFNVYPAEVEQVLATHPAVTEAAAVGIPHPYTGQTVKAFVVAAAPVEPDELLAHCRRNLARFKCPTEIEFTPDLPHSATGKVRKGELHVPENADV
jgi:long-chain acyl-CoA synthetase